MKRRTFLSAATSISLAGVSCGEDRFRKNKTNRPNVILIMTDDQGFGDLGCHGNELISTPALDRFAAESTEFTRFYVNPVCAPTRASLMTGRYHFRTGVLGTMSGEALIAPDEITIAHRLREGGYRTAIFGKWHLGDNCPRRPVDMGFEEAVVHNGGGLSQPSCPPGVGYHDPEHQRKHGYTLYTPFEHWISSNNYFDPVLMHNGVETQYEGYCTDIFFGEAARYIEAHRDEPFFVYLAANAPHAPEIVSEAYLEPYRAMGLDEKTARGYAMITNIDNNFRQLMERLETLGLADNTVVIFMSDNGPQYSRYTAGLRGWKSHFTEGGIRSPVFIRWRDFPAGKKVDHLAAHIDIAPTILDICGIGAGTGDMDGDSVLPLLSESDSSNPDRTLFFQGNRGIPERHRQCAVVTRRYKLIDGSALFDLSADPGEKEDIAAAHPEVVAALRGKYEAWFDDVSSTRGFDPQRIWVGDSRENPVTLTPQDWRGERSRFVQKEPLGHWLLDVREDGKYSAEIHLPEGERIGMLHLAIGEVSLQTDLAAERPAYRFGPFELPSGPARLDAWIERGERTFGVARVIVTQV